LLYFYLLIKLLSLFGKVVKTQMMQPFCIGHHINVRPNMSITFVMTNAQKKFITFELPPLCMMTKTRFGHHRIGDQIFNCLVTKLGNQKHLVSNSWSSQLMNICFLFAQKKIGSYPNNFTFLVNNGHWYNNWFFFVAQKFSVPNLNDQKFSVAFGHRLGNWKISVVNCGN
jgi:hypothetical protein